MITEFASTWRNLAQEIRADELFNDLSSLLFGNFKPVPVIKPKPTGHNLNSIMHFRGLKGR